MIVALHFSAKDKHLAVALRDWLAEIGPFPNHTLLVASDRRAATVMFNSCGFASVKYLTITDDVADKWPESANHALKKIAKCVQYSLKAQPFFWIEPDAIVLRGSAFDEIEAEYNLARAAGKHFLGDLQNAQNNKVAKLPGFVNHMSGIGVYPGALTQYAGEVFYAEAVPFDIAAGPQIYPQAMQSELLFHVWNREGRGLSFASWADFEQKVLSRRPKCAVFHADKLSSLIPILREHGKEGDVSWTNAPASSAESTERMSDSVLRSSSAAPTSEPESATECGKDGFH